MLNKEEGAVMEHKGLVIGSIACGLVCACAVAVHTHTIQAEAAAARDAAMARYGGEQVEVCVAKHDIAPGERISDTNTTIRSWIAEMLPRDPIRSIDDIRDTSPSETILSGEVLSRHRFSSTHRTIDIPSGHRAVGVSVDEARCAASVLEAGQSIDIYATGSSGTSRIADHVLVLSLEKESSSSRHIRVVLAVKPENVEQIIAASSNVDLHFTLPSTNDGGR
jgi:pilus assembly protein CpaB